MDLKTGQTVRITIKKAVNRAAARKTLERLFMSDQNFAAPFQARTSNFAPRPKRRGGRIWTKYANKIHPTFVKGLQATLKVTPQVAKDLKSVDDLVDVTKA